MSELTANALMPLFSALSEEEQRNFADKVKKLLKKRDSPLKKKKKSVYDTMDPIFHPDNREQLVSEIMYGS